MHWLRNREILDTQDEMYQTIGSVNTQYSLRDSNFRSTLIVSSLNGVFGTQTYTCVIQNNFGSASEDIVLRRQGIEF